MTARLEVRRINCTQCSAPLELHGGHKVERIVCSYCGSLLEGGEGHRVLKRHYVEQGRRSFLPLQPGDEGPIKGVSFIVIGFIGYRSAEDSWTEFCLFSPTHGYAWLSWEQGHYVFIRRLRDLPVPAGSWRLLQTKRVIAQGAGRFKFYEVYRAEVVDIGGELPWRGEIGDQVDCADAVDPPRILSQEIEAEEIEYQLGEYLPPAEVGEAFGKPAIANAGQPRSVHPAQPFTVSAFDRYLQLNGRIFGTLAFLGLLVTLFLGGGETLLREQVSWEAIQARDGKLTRSFQITQPSRLIEVRLYSSLKNAWLWLDLDVTHQGEDVFSLGKEISYYAGYEGGEHWTEGSQSASALFRVPEAGLYALNITATDWGGARHNNPIRVAIDQGLVLRRWFFILTVVLAPFAFWIPLRKLRFEHRRWAPVAEDDD